MITNEVQRSLHRGPPPSVRRGTGQPQDQPRRKAIQARSAPDDAMNAQACDLRAELDEYDRLRSGAESTFEASSLQGLAALLIKARIARGWSQWRLADVLRVAEQQVHRYEANDYRSASLARICDVATALDVTITEKLSLCGPDTG